MKWIGREFAGPVSRMGKVIYLNSGTHSITAESVFKEKLRWEYHYEANPTLNLMNAWKDLWQSQSGLAKWLGLDADGFLLRRDITASINAAVMGFDFRNSAEIVTTDLEYGAVRNILRLRAERSGLKIKKISVSDLGNRADYEQVFLERMEEAVTKKTGLICVSHVVTGTGLKLPVEQLAERTRVPIVVDGAHALGGITVDLSWCKKSGVMYAANLHKWLCGAKGGGFLWVPRHLRDRVSPLEAGWTSFERGDEYKFFAPREPFAYRMAQTASGDLSSWMAISALLKLWRGKETQWLGEIRKRSVILYREALKLGLEPLVNHGGVPQTPLLSFVLPKKLTNLESRPTMERILDETGVQVALPRPLGGAILRLSAHVYTSNDAIETGIKKLKKWIDKNA